MQKIAECHCYNDSQWTPQVLISRGNGVIAANAQPITGDYLLVRYKMSGKASCNA